MKEYTLKLSAKAIKHIMESLGFSACIDVSADWEDDSHMTDILLEIKKQTNGEITLKDSDISLFRPDNYELEDTISANILIDEFDVTVDKGEKNAKI